MRRTWLVCVLFTLVACNSAPRGQPADAVKRFFQAIQAGDCNTALGTLSQAYRAEVQKKADCDEFLRDWSRYGLEQVIETQVDGRNDKAQLVRARIRGRKTDSIIRVQAEGGQWRIFSM